MVPVMIPPRAAKGIHQARRPGGERGRRAPTGTTRLQTLYSVDIQSSSVLFVFIHTRGLHSTLTRKHGTATVYGHPVCVPLCSVYSRLV